jgi:hypothetical protein
MAISGPSAAGLVSELTQAGLLFSAVLALAGQRLMPDCPGDPFALAFTQALIVLSKLRCNEPLHLFFLPHRKTP